MTQIINESGLNVTWILNRVPPHDLSATLIAKGTFQLRPKGTAQLSDRQEPLSGDQHWNEDPRNSLLASSDFVPYKPKTDVLLTGHCHAPGVKGLSRCSATFGLDEWRKTIFVIGNRKWEKTMEGALPSAPKAFKKIGLQYENSFGGPGFNKNPFGTGYFTELPSDDSPQLRLPNVEDPKNVIHKVEDHPTPIGFGPLPHSAPERREKRGQYDEIWKRDHWPWLPLDFDWSYFNAAPPDQQREEPLLGNERIIMENMHPEVHSYHSHLPGLRLRWFLKQVVDGITKFQEVEMKIDTLRVDMDREELILVWRGIAPVASPNLVEIPHQYVVSERMGSVPLTPKHYALCLEGRIAPKTREEGEEEEDHHPDLHIGINPEMVPRNWQDHFDASLERATERLAWAETELGPQPDPPPPDWDALLEAYRKIGEAELPSPAELREESEAWQKSQKHRTGLRTAWERERWTRKSFLARSAQNRDFPRQDLSGLDLSGSDLTGINFREAVLTGTNFSKSILKNADFTRADLRKADLGESDLSGASLTGADLDEANLSRAKLSRANLDEASLTHTVLRNSDLSGASAIRTSFHQADLVAADLKGIRCPGADFSLAHIVNAHFEDADMTNASVEGAKGEGLSMRNATLTKLHGGKGADFSRANLSGVEATASTWEESNLQGAVLKNSKLNRANFNSTLLKGADLNGSDLIRARFMNANLEGASLVQVNLFRGSLEGARLKDANFKQSNLYGVEFWKADDSQANFLSANLIGTKHGK